MIDNIDLKVLDDFRGVNLRLENNFEEDIYYLDSNYPKKGYLKETYKLEEVFNLII